MNGLIEALVNAMMQSAPTIKRLYIQSLLIFYQGISMAMQTGNRKLLIERVLDVKMEPRQLFSCLGSSTSRKRALKMYLDAVEEIKRELSNPRPRN